MTDVPKTPSEDQKALSVLTDEFVDCIHCGLCLEACPTYVELGREEDSPRGRIYLMRSVAEGRGELDSSTMEHLDVCLGCRACETACPSGVRYGFLLEHVRTHVEEARKRPLLRRLAWRGLLEVFTHSGLMALAMFGATLPSRLLKQKPRAPGGLISLVMGAKHPGGDLYLDKQPPLRPVRLPQHAAAVGEKRLKVGLLEGCVMPVLFPEVGAATIRVLTKLGCEVVVPNGQGCCGALHVHNGYSRQAAKMAARNIKAFLDEGCDAIVVNSAGCGSTMKEYANLFEAGSEERALAETFSAKVRDISEIVAELLPQQQLASVDLTVTYHDACHLAHGQGIRVQPRAMLAAVPGLQMVDLPESDHCCGSAGIYSFAQPRLAGQLQQRKIGNIKSTHAAVVATGNPGCQMWIRSGLNAADTGIRALHPIEIIDLALGGPAGRAN